MSDHAPDDAFNALIASWDDWYAHQYDQHKYEKLKQDYLTFSEKSDLGRHIGTQVAHGDQIDLLD